MPRRKKPKQLSLIEAPAPLPLTPERIAQIEADAEEAVKRLEERQGLGRLLDDEALARGELYILEMPLKMGALGRPGRITTYLYCNETAFRNTISRMQGVEPPARRPADRCMHGRPHNCFKPEGEPDWCYVTGTPPPDKVLGLLPGMEGMLDREHKPITIWLCCPQAARLQVRELHGLGWTDIELTTESPDREVQGFVRYMNRTMPCLNQ